LAESLGGLSYTTRTSLVEQR